jgi:serine/threonine-protein kinase
VLHQIGAGALGPVFRAYNPEQDRLVAIKLFRLDLTPERVHKLVAQLQTLIDADLTHAAIAAPVAAGIVEVSAYLALDFVAAESADVVAREHGPAPPIEGLRVATQLAGALEFAFDANVAHGALHPRDVLVSPDDTKLTGLGIAQVLERLGITVPVRRPYAAPERVSGAAWDRRADIFSLAALVHELIWGRRITGVGQQAAAALTSVEGGDLERLREVFATALAEDPESRFDSPIEFADSLRSALSFGSRSVVATSSMPRPPAVMQFEPELAPLAVAAASARDLELKLPLDGHDPEDEDRTIRMPEPPISPPVERRLAILMDPPDPEVPSLARVPEPAHAADPVDDDATVRTFERQAGETQMIEAPSLPAPTIFTASMPPDRARSAVWPLALALAVGLAVGFATGYSVAGRGSASEQAGLAPGVGVNETEVQLKPDPVESADPATSSSNNPSSPGGAIPADPPASSDRGSGAASAASPTAAGPPRSARAGPEIDRTPSAANGRLLIRSTPSGATAFLDGREAGKTPLTISAVDPGTHRVRVTRDGFVAQEQSLSITADRPSQSLAFQLLPARRAAAPAPKPPASAASSGSRAGAPMIVESRPAGASVLLDGQLIGKTPLTLGDVSAGAHEVSIELAGYRSWTTSVRVVPGERHRVAASLER